MRIPLATVADPLQIERVRELLEGRACVVVGSAPLPGKYADVADTDVVIAVNGGISSVARAVDLWVVASRPQDKPGSGKIKPLHKTMLQQAKGRTVGHVLFLRGPKDASEGDTLAALKELGVRHLTWSICDKATKLWIEKTTCARSEKHPCSSGILATAIALYCGAASVRMVGFSWKPGYQYIKNANPPQWWRNHCGADKRAIRELRMRYGNRLSGNLVEAVAA